jgi:hypothetical protein
MNFELNSIPFHSMASPEPLSGSMTDLYAVYFEVAKRDHACRRAALYGEQTPPPGHTPFRPLPLEHFEARFRAASATVGGEEIFRKQLARQAQVYGVALGGSSGRQAA